MAVKKTKKVNVDDLLDQALVWGSSLVYLAKDTGEDLVAALEKHDLLNSEEGKKMAGKIKSRFDDRREEVRAKVKKQLRKVIDELGIATKEDLKK